MRAALGVVSETLLAGAGEAEISLAVAVPDDVVIDGAATRPRLVT